MFGERISFTGDSLVSLQWTAQWLVYCIRVFFDFISQLISLAQNAIIDFWPKNIIDCQWHKDCRLRGRWRSHYQSLEPDFDFEWRWRYIFLWSHQRSISNKTLSNDSSVWASCCSSHGKCQCHVFRKITTWLSRQWFSHPRDSMEEG